MQHLPDNAYNFFTGRLLEYPQIWHSSKVMLWSWDWRAFINMMEQITNPVYYLKPKVKHVVSIKQSFLEVNKDKSKAKSFINVRWWILSSITKCEKQTGRHGTIEGGTIAKKWFETLTGVEPMTSWTPSGRSVHWATRTYCEQGYLTQFMSDRRTACC